MGEGSERSFFGRDKKYFKRGLLFDRRCGIIHKLFGISCRQFPGVAKFGIALEWGSRGRWFESSHSDHVVTKSGFVTTFFCFKGKAEASAQPPGAGEPARGSLDGGEHMSQVEQYIITIPDFPEKGILFRDITSVLKSAEGLQLAVDEMAACLDGVEFDAVVGLESRGFLFGMPIAYKLHKPFIPVRKKGKLPRETVEATYDLEYGTATIEIHRDDVRPGSRVVLVDDLIATGGTLEAAAGLLERQGAEIVKIVCLLELKGLHGRDRLSRYPVDTIVAYEGK